MKPYKDAAIARLMAQPWGPPITDQPKGQTMQTTFTSIFGGTVTPQSRADLITHHPAFVGLNSDNDGNPCVWTNSHECPNCNETWDQDWSCNCDDACPHCEISSAPYRMDWIPPGKGEPGEPLFDLWQSLPEAGSPAADADQHASGFNRLGRVMRGDLQADQPQPMWLCVWVTNYGNNDLRDSFTIHNDKAEAEKAYAELLTLDNLHSAAIAPISKATEPHWQDQR